ncbi:MAG: methyltransferase domain-containing protein [Anaerolineales bacterium]|nr:methyltransferase domain-containing protein [Anaerolineales bacterium]
MSGRCGRPISRPESAGAGCASRRRCAVQAMRSSNWLTPRATPYADGAFDLVTCRIAAHHFEILPRLLQEAARLKPGGSWPSSITSYREGQPATM